MCSATSPAAAAMVSRFCLSSSLLLLLLLLVLVLVLVLVIGATASATLSSDATFIALRSVAGGVCGIHAFCLACAVGERREEKK